MVLGMAVRPFTLESPLAHLHSVAAVLEVQLSQLVRTLPSAIQVYDWIGSCESMGASIWAHMG